MLDVLVNTANPPVAADSLGKRAAPPQSLCSAASRQCLSTPVMFSHQQAWASLHPMC